MKENVDIPEWDDATTVIEEILLAMQNIDRYNEPEESEREHLFGSYQTACFTLYKLEQDIFTCFPIDADCITRICQATAKQAGHILEWLKQDGVLGKVESKYYFKNCKYTAMFSYLVAKT